MLLSRTRQCQWTLSQFCISIDWIGRFRSAGIRDIRLRALGQEPRERKALPSFINLSRTIQLTPRSSERKPGALQNTWQLFRHGLILNLSEIDFAKAPTPCTRGKCGSSRVLAHAGGVRGFTRSWHRGTVNKSAMRNHQTLSNGVALRQSSADRA